MLRPNEVLVQQARVRRQQGVEPGARHRGPRRRDLQHPEDGGRLRVLLGPADRRRKAAERRGHPFHRLIERRRLVQVDPRHAQMQGVREALVGDRATLERPRQLDIVMVQHIVTISYYSISAK